MCGILIWFKSWYENDFNEFIEHFISLHHRTKKGVGVGVIYNSGNFDIIKDGRADIPEFIMEYGRIIKRKFEDDNLFAIIAHTRKASTAINKICAQPFYSENSFLVHNGHAPELELVLNKNEDYKYECGSDSEIIYGDLLMNTDEEDEKSIEDYFDDLNETGLRSIGSVVYYNKPSRNLFIYNDFARLLYVKYNEYDLSIKVIKNVFTEDMEDVLEPGLYKIDIYNESIKLKSFYRNPDIKYKEPENTVKNTIKYVNRKMKVAEKILDILDNF